MSKLSGIPQTGMVLDAIIKRGRMMVIGKGGGQLNLPASKYGSLKERMDNPNGAKARRFQEVTNRFFGAN